MWLQVIRCEQQASNFSIYLATSGPSFDVLLSKRIKDRAYHTTMLPLSDDLFA